MKVVVVDDQKLVREGIVTLLQFNEEVEVIAQYDNGQTLLDGLSEVAPDIILLDLSMPIMNGIATLKQLNSRGITIPVIVLTTFDDPKLVLDSLSNGAKGFVLKDIALDSLVNAMKTILNGETYFQPAITETLLKYAPKLDNDFSEFKATETLSVREIEVLRLVANGYSNKEIAEALHKSEGTIKNHVSNLLSKLGVRDRTRAVLLAIEMGILQ